MNIFDIAMMKKLGGGNGGSSVQPDLSQNDPNAADYVKNRTHWSEVSTIVEEQTISGFASMGELYAAHNPFIFSPIAGDRYTVHWDGIAYDVEAQHFNGTICLGNENYLSMNTGGDIPFAILVFGDDNIYISTESTANSHTICIEGEVVHKLDPKYLTDAFSELLVFMHVEETLGDNKWVVNFSKTYDEMYSRIMEGKPVMIFNADLGSNEILRVFDIRENWIQCSGVSFYSQCEFYEYSIDLEDDRWVCTRVKRKQLVMQDT